MRGGTFLWAFALVVNGSYSWRIPSATHRARIEFLRGGSNRNNPNYDLQIEDRKLKPPSLGMVKRRQEQSQQLLQRRMTESSSLRGGETRSKNLQGVFFMAVASLSFSIMFLGVKLYSNAPTFTLVFYRSVVQAMLSGLLLLKKGTNPLGPNKDNVRVLLALRGGFGSLAVAAFFYAVQHLPLPDAITLQFTTPVFAAWMAVHLLGEPWKPTDKLGAAFCLLGVLLIARPSWLFGAVVTHTAAAASQNSAVATIVGLTGAAFAAMAYVLVRRIGSRADSNVMVFYYAMFSTLTAPLGSKFLGDAGTWDVMGRPSPSELMVLAGLGVFGFLGQLFTNMGLTMCDSAATATLVTNIQICFAFLFEVTLLHESLSLCSVAGTTLIVGYMVFAGINKIAKEKKDVVQIEE